MHIRAILWGDLQVVHALLIVGGWEERVADFARFTELVARSVFAFIATSEGKVVGFVRGLTDGISNGCISMLVVAPEYRNQTIKGALPEKKTVVPDYCSNSTTYRFAQHKHWCTCKPPASTSNSVRAPQVRHDSGCSVP